MLKTTPLNSSITRVNTPRSVRKVTMADYPLIESWYEARGARMPRNGMLSDLGYIVDNRVVAWLYLTNSNMAMIENIVADPNTVPSLRRNSLKKLVGFLIDLATAMGYTNIFGITQHPAVIELSKAFGFKELKEFKVVVLTDNQ